MNTKVEEALGVLDRVLTAPLVSDQLTAKGRAARTTLAAHISQQDATIARMFTREQVAELMRGVVAKWRAEAVETWQAVRGGALEDCADELEAALSVAQGQGWRPMESAPRDGVEVLTWHDYGTPVANPNHPYYGKQGRVIVQAPFGDGSCFPSELAESGSVTFWQPLPAAPAQPDGVSK